jgi:hypothetical protein
MGSEDYDCMVSVKAYYKTIDAGNEAFVPACTEFWVLPEESVYVLAEEDSVTMKVAYFYKGTSGREKYFIGYLLKSSIHETPYVKPNRP